MNKKYLSIAVLFVLILVLATAGWLISPKTPRKSATTLLVPSLSPLASPAYLATAAPQIKQVEVDYTDTGFNPAKITIKKGSAVVFYNKSKTAMMVTSKLPEFNQTIEGNVYAYTFSQPGNWDFQNQKHPSDRGTITVTQ